MSFPYVNLIVCLDLKSVESSPRIAYEDKNNQLSNTLIPTEL